MNEQKDLLAATLVYKREILKSVLGMVCGRVREIPTYEIKNDEFITRIHPDFADPLLFPFAERNLLYVFDDIQAQIRELDEQLCDIPQNA